MEHGDASIASDDGYETADALCESKVEYKDAWILDSGCTFHMTPNKNWIKDFKPIDSENVLLGDNKSCKIMGSGSVRIRLHTGQVRLIQEVRYVPALKKKIYCHLVCWIKWDMLYLQKMVK